MNYIMCNVENNTDLIRFSKNNIYLHFKSPWFLSPELEEVGKWSDIVKSLLICNTVCIPSLHSDKLVLLTVSTPFLAENASSTQDNSNFSQYTITLSKRVPHNLDTYKLVTGCLTYYLYVS